MEFVGIVPFTVFLQSFVYFMWCLFFITSPIPEFIYLNLLFSFLECNHKFVNFVDLFLYFFLLSFFSISALIYLISFTLLALSFIYSFSSSLMVHNVRLFI